MVLSPHPRLSLSSRRQGEITDAPDSFFKKISPVERVGGNYNIINSLNILFIGIRIGSTVLKW